MAVVVVGDIPVAEAEALIQKHFGGIPAAKGAAATVDTSVPAHKETLINMSTDPEAQGWTVSVGFKGKAEHDETVGGYRKTLVESLVAQMLNLRLQRNLASSQRAVPRARRRARAALAARSSFSKSKRRCRRARSPRASAR